MAADERLAQWRARVILLVIGAGFGLVVLALFSLQVVRREAYVSLARENRQFHTRVLAPRGVISDRNGRPLADNVYQGRLTIARSHARMDDPSVLTLLELLDLDPDLLEERIDRAPPGDRVTLLRHATTAQIAKVEEHRAVLPHVQLKVEPRRRYHYGRFAAHVLGYVGEVRGSDLEDDGGEAFYEPGDIIGRQGVEAMAEDLLRGRHGRKVVEVNAAGHIVGEVESGHIPVIPGNQIYLTIHHELQSRLEELLDGLVGAGVVLEVGTGDILAIASAPAYDPNLFTGGISARDWAGLNQDPRKPLFNRALQGTYPPGSPFKLITAAAALRLGKITPQSTFQPCTGGYRFGNRVFRCWDPAGHGRLDLRGAIVQSCDVYFYQVAQLLEVDELAETARAFGLGRATGLRLRGEMEGLLPTAEWYDRRYGRRGWTRGLMLNNAIGQGELLVTPLQMARTMAAIGGDGYLYRPNLVLARENVYGLREVRRIRRRSEPVCDEAVLSFLRDAMVGVVSDEEGTGRLSQVAGVEVAGKTGTAENPHGEDHAWFAAYAPAERPEVAVALIVENAGHGGSVAAPIVGDLLHTYFESRQARLGGSEEVGR